MDGACDLPGDAEMAEVSALDQQLVTSLARNSQAAVASSSRPRSSKQMKSRKRSKKAVFGLASSGTNSMIFTQW